ncbi:MAG: hypothetical protein WCD00_02980, partial [Desulfuromonadaceae bacterium]
LTAFMLSRRIGTVWGVVLITIGAQMGSYKWWFFLPPLLLLANPDLLKKPLRWLSAWLVLSLINCLFQATAGIALTLGTFPAAAWIFAVAYREKALLHAWQQNKKMVLISSALLVLFLLVTAPLMSGFMTYAQEQGTVNELANGTLLNRPARIPEWFRWKSPLAWGCFRIGGWMVAIAVLWHLLVRCFSTENAPSRRFTFPTSATVVAISGIFSTIVFIPYSMGRIDSTNLSRTGSIGVFALGLLVPLVIRLSATPSGTARGILCGLLMGCALAPFPIYPGILARQAMDVPEAPSSTVWFDGEANGLPKMGKTYIDSDQLAMLLLFKQVTDNVLKPHETYYDLTNNLAFYYFLDKKVSSLYAGYYIVTSETIQNKVISCLERTPPPLVWVGPTRELGSGGASMRSYRVYRWLMLQGYVPLYHNGLAFLVRPDRYRELTGGDQPLQRKVIELTSFLAPADIQGVSAAWGSSFDGLTSRFSDVASSTRSTITSGTRFFSSLDGGVPAVTENVVFGVPVDGAQADFLLVRLSAMGNNEKIPIMVRWRGVTGREEVMECQGHPGRSLLLPLGSHPAWLLSPRIANVSIDVAGWWPVPPVTSLKLLKLRR